MPHPAKSAAQSGMDADPLMQAKVADERVSGADRQAATKSVVGRKYFMTSNPLAVEQVPRTP